MDGKVRAVRYVWLQTCRVQAEGKQPSRAPAKAVYDGYVQMRLVGDQGDNHSSQQAAPACTLCEATHAMRHMQKFNSASRAQGAPRTCQLQALAWQGGCPTQAAKHSPLALPCRHPPPLELLQLQGQMLLHLDPRVLRQRATAARRPACGRRRHRCACAGPRDLAAVPLWFPLATCRLKLRRGQALAETGQLPLPLPLRVHWSYRDP